MSKGLYDRLLADNGIKIEGGSQSNPRPREPFYIYISTLIYLNKNLILPLDNK